MVVVVVVVVIVVVNVYMHELRTSHNYGAQRTSTLTHLQIYKNATHKMWNAHAHNVMRCTYSIWETRNIAVHSLIHILHTYTHTYTARAHAIASRQYGGFRFLVFFVGSSSEWLKSVRPHQIRKSPIRWMYCTNGKMSHTHIQRITP